MNAYPPLLIALESGQPSYPALEYGLGLAGLFRSPVAILGVTKTGPAPCLEAQIAAAREDLEAGGIACEVVWDQGSFERALLRCLAKRPGALTLFSDLRKPVWGRYVRIGRFRRLMASISSPLLRVQRPCLPPRHILVCSGGLAYTIPLEKLSIQIAVAASARITIFHVVEPVTFEYPLAREVRDHWQELLKTDTPQARHLQSALRAAQQANVEARVLVRHGPLIHELFAEIRSGDYDLVAVGSTYSSHALSHLARPDVAALVTASFDCPVLTARGKISDTYG